MNVTLIKKEVTGKLASFVNMDGSPKYPGPQNLTWIKAPGMPWVLGQIEPWQPPAQRQ